MTKSQLEAQVQALAACLETFDVAHFQRTGLTQQWALDYREGLYNNLVAAREALAEAEDEPSPYAPSEDYLKALRSFGLTDEQCVEELRSARDSDFELHLADEVRKAYDQGKAEGHDQGRLFGYAKGYEAGKADGKTIGYAEGYDEGYDEGFDAADGRGKPKPRE